MHAGSGLFGPGFRANATIGRAVRLILMNLGGGWPGARRHGDAGQPGQVHLRDRRARGGQPLGAAARRPRVRGRTRAWSRSSAARARTTSTTTCPPRRPASSSTCRRHGRHARLQRGLVLLAEPAPGRARARARRDDRGGRLHPRRRAALRLRARAPAAPPAEAGRHVGHARLATLDGRTTDEHARLPVVPGPTTSTSWSPAARASTPASSPTAASAAPSAASSTASVGQVLITTFPSAPVRRAARENVVMSRPDPSLARVAVRRARAARRRSGAGDAERRPGARRRRAGRAWWR